MIQRQQFWYRVLVRDVHGHILTKEGDIPGNNVIHAMVAIENMNRNAWGCTLIQIALHSIDWETGHIEAKPETLWTRSAGTVRGDLVWAPSTPSEETLPVKYDPDEAIRNYWDGEEKKAKASQSVSFPNNIGTARYFTQESFTTMTPKGEAP